MDRQEKIQRLAEHMKVTLEEAARALDEADGDLLDAALLLERGRAPGERTVHTHSTAAALAPAPEPTTGAETAKTQAPAGDKVTEVLIALLTGLVTHPVLNGVRLEKEGSQITTVPAVVLLALLLVRWWVAPALFAVGLLAGWSFKWSGPQWDNIHLNTGWAALESKVAQLRESMKGGRRRG